MRDVRYAARLLWRTPLFTITAVLSIAVGVGVDTAVFSVANAVLFRQPAAVRDPQQLVDISRAGGESIVGFLSYGGVAAGTRSVQQLKQVVTALRMVPVVEAVNVPFAVQFLNDDREVRANDAMILGAEGMLRELARLTTLLRQLPTAV